MMCLPDPPSAGSIFVMAKVDRRNAVSRTALVQQVHEAFADGTLCLTASEAASQLKMERDACWRILTELEQEGVLHLMSDGRFMLRGDR